MLLSCLKADFLKTKRTSIRIAHLVIPIVTALIFIAYGSYAPWDNDVKVELYYQILGMALPFLIGLFCAILSEQERSAGCFQTMLLSSCKAIPFLSKLLLLLLFCAGALFMASMIFGAAFHFGLQCRPVGIAFYPLAALLMFESSIPMYLLHLYVSFRFNQGVSVSLGIAESVLSALFLTGLGESIWEYVPAAWPARMVTTFLQGYRGALDARAELKQASCIGLFMITIGMAVYLFWAYHWEGTQTAD